MYKMLVIQISVGGLFRINNTVDMYLVATAGYFMRGVDKPMSKYTILLLDLLPLGKAWKRSLDKNITKFLSIFAYELERVEERVNQLFVETNPATATETIPDWEEMCGIPESNEVPEFRRARILAHLRMIGRGRLNKAKYYSIASSFGYNIYPNTTSPYVRIYDRLHFGFRADIGRADIDEVWDETSGSSCFTWEMHGTSIESDTKLQTVVRRFNRATREVVFTNI
jgi:hypothetical protein